MGISYRTVLRDGEGEYEEKRSRFIAHVYHVTDEQEVLFPLTSGNELTIMPERRPLALSLLPITAVCSGVNITNVRWPLQNAELNQAFPNAVSNRIKGEAPVRVSLSDGILGVYMYWENQSL